MNRRQVPGARSKTRHGASAKRRSFGWEAAAHLHRHTGTCNYGAPVVVASLAAEVAGGRRVDTYMATKRPAALSAHDFVVSTNLNVLISHGRRLRNGDRRAGSCGPAVPVFPSNYYTWKA
eukprot:scaffold609_cov234-Pinguiococcus_pyrenoidosus.AAC.2